MGFPIILDRDLFTFDFLCYYFDHIFINIFRYLYEKTFYSLKTIFLFLKSSKTNEKSLIGIVNYIILTESVR